jgi:hypothetical protein
MNQYSNFSFNFHNNSFPKYPHSIKARYCFESELIKIPKTDAMLELDPKTWVIFDEENENLWAMTSDQFLDIYLPSDKKAQRYFEFVFDSANNNYYPNSIASIEELLETILEDFIEKPVQLSLKGRLALVWDLLLNKKIFISKY